MKAWHPLIALVIAGGAVTYHFVDQRRHDAQLDELRTKLASLSDSVERGQSSVVPRQTIFPPQSLAVPAPSQPAKRAELAPADEASSQERDNPRPVEPAEVRAQLDTAFAQETKDPAWTYQAQETARMRIAAALPETSSVRSIECRSSMCRFETVHEDKVNVRQFMDRAFVNAETHVWNGGFFSGVVEEPGSDEVVLVSYLAREGEALALVQQLE